MTPSPHTALSSPIRHRPLLALVAAFSLVACDRPSPTAEAGGDPPVGAPTGSPAPGGSTTPGGADRTPIAAASMPGGTIAVIEPPASGALPPPVVPPEPRPPTTGGAPATGAGSRTTAGAMGSTAPPPAAGDVASSVAPNDLSQPPSVSPGSSR